MCVWQWWWSSSSSSPSTTTIRSDLLLATNNMSPRFMGLQLRWRWPLNCNYTSRSLPQDELTGDMLITWLPCVSGGDNYLWRHSMEMRASRNYNSVSLSFVTKLNNVRVSKIKTRSALCKYVFVVFTYKVCNNNTIIILLRTILIRGGGKEIPRPPLWTYQVSLSSSYNCCFGRGIIRETDIYRMNDFFFACLYVVAASNNSCLPHPMGFR